MTREKQIALAKEIAQALPEVTRNEWMRWMQVAERYGLDKAIKYAERMANDITMRPAIKRSNRLIAKSMKKYGTQIARLPKSEQMQIMGLVSWMLAINYAGFQT